MGQWVVSVLGLEPLHLRVTLAPADALVTGILHAPMPHVKLSVAMRITSLRIAADVDGSSGRRRLV